MRERGKARKCTFEIAFRFSVLLQREMLIALVSAPQGGKKLVTNHLVAAHGFKRVLISGNAPLATDSSTLYFASSSDFLAYATLNWRRDFVTTDLREKSQLQEFLKRPFVVVVSIQAPIRVRWLRAVQASVPSFISLNTMIDA